MIREILLMNMLANVRLHFLAMQRLANKLQWPGCKSGIRVKILMTNIFCSQLSKLLPAGPKRQTMTRMLIRQLRYVQIISSNLLMSNSRQNASKTSAWNRAVYTWHWTRQSPITSCTVRPCCLWIALLVSPHMPVPSTEALASNWSSSWGTALWPPAAPQG